MKRPALQNKRVGVLRTAFRTRKVFGTFEKRAPGVNFTKVLHLQFTTAAIVFTQGNKSHSCQIQVSRKFFYLLIKTALFYPSDLVNNKTTIPSGSVMSGEYISTIIFAVTLDQRALWANSTDLKKMTGSSI